MTYPQSHPIIDSPEHLLQSIGANRDACSQTFLDTTEDEKRHYLHEDNHHQGLARTHKLSEGSVYYFLTRSGIGSKGRLMQFNLQGSWISNTCWRPIR